MHAVSAVLPLIVLLLSSPVLFVLLVFTFTTVLIS